MFEIIPAILTDNRVELMELLARAEGVSSRIHIDIIDGIFANNHTVLPEHLVGIETNLLIDFHLMVDDPIEWLEKCSEAGADRVIAQIEKMPDQFAFLSKAGELGLGVGFALDVGTPVTQIEKEILNDVDVIMVMGVRAGFGGQAFDPSCLDVIAKLSQIRASDQTPFLIATDGGETLDTIDDVIASGAHEVVVGRRIFEGDIVENIRKFEEASQKI